MPLFCVEKIAQSTGEHIIHELNSGCKILAAGVETVPLGAYSSLSDARNAASEDFSATVSCMNCSSEHDEATNSAIAATIAANNI